MGYGMKGFRDKNWGEVEQIQEKAGAAGMYESFTESGPQSVVQLVIILSTGRISTAQKVSLPISILSLTMASSRAFFIQRSRDERDPDPALKTLLLYIFPRMLLMVLNSIILWTMIGGLVSGYIFSGIVLCFVNVYVSLSGFSKMVKKGNSSAIGVIMTLAYINTHVYVLVGILMGFFTDLTVFFVLLSVSLVIAAALFFFKFKSKLCGPLVLPPAVGFPEVTIELETNTGEFAGTPSSEDDVLENGSSIDDSEKNLGSEDESTHFRVISALTSIWLPCVVGDQQYLFLTSAMVSITNKICLLILAVILNFSGSIQTNVFLLWCRDIETVQNMTNRDTMDPCKGFWNNPYPEAHLCFSGRESQNNDTHLYQLIRICGNDQDENRLRLLLLLIVSISSSLASIAAYQLHRISNYVRLYKISKKFCCFQTQPIVHRSLLFRLAEKDENDEQLKEFLDASTSDMVNRTRRGETALHISTRLGAHKCSVLLIKAGAVVKENSQGQLPDVLQNIDVINNLEFSNISLLRILLLTNWQRKNLEHQESVNRLITRIPEEEIQRKKCLLIGDGNVGKTCLIMTQATGQFPPGWTPGYDNQHAQTNTLLLQLQDTQGQEEYNELITFSYSNVDILIVCFSIASPTSYTNIRYAWKPLLRRYSDVPIMLVGTKMDLRDDPKVIEDLARGNEAPITKDQGELLAREINAVKYMECSALTKVGLHEMFLQVHRIVFPEYFQG